MRYKQHIYPLIISLISKDDISELPDAILSEGERTIYRKGHPIRLTQFPSGEKMMVFILQDFLELDIDMFLLELSKNTRILNSSNRYWLKLKCNLGEYNGDIRTEVLRRFEEIKRFFEGYDHPTIISESRGTSNEK